MDMHQAFQLACERAGSQAELARKLDRHKATVSRWSREGVPQNECAGIEKLTGVRCEDLRPDLNWPPRVVEA